MRRLIPDTENGLLSRFILYRMPTNTRWHRTMVRHDDPSDVRFQRIGSDFHKRLISFVGVGNKYEFLIPDSLGTAFDDEFSLVNDDCCEIVDKAVAGVVRRMGLIAFRMMMVLTALRAMGSERHGERLVCDKRDYTTAMLICRTLLTHSLHFYTTMSQQKRKPAEGEEKGAAMRRNKFLNGLPDRFTRKEYDERVRAEGENHSTAEKWLARYIADGLLRRKAQGEYEKQAQPEE